MGTATFFPYLIPKKLGVKYISSTTIVYPHQSLETYLDKIILKKGISDTKSC